MPVDAAGVAGRDEQALLAPPQVDEHRFAAGEDAAGERRVVLAVAVAQVQGRAVGAPGPQRRQAAVAPGGADGHDRVRHVGEERAQRRVVAPGEPVQRALAQERAGRQEAAGRHARAAARLDDDDAAVGELAVRARHGRRGRALGERERPDRGQRRARRQIAVRDTGGEGGGQVVVAGQRAVGIRSLLSQYGVAQFRSPPSDGGRPGEGTSL